MPPAFGATGGEEFREAAGAFLDLMEDAALPDVDFWLAVIGGMVS